jgi:predicted dinucleotide-binding enzyme
MKVAVVGKGNVGGGLADLWEKAGHDVSRIGRDGGDVSDADVVLLAIPGAAINEAFETVRGWEGKTVIDATNLIGAQPPEGHSSNTEYVKSRTGGPTAKSFNLNFAALYPRLGESSKRPGNIWCGDEEARSIVEQLIRDAGYEPLRGGGIENAGASEAFLRIMFAINQDGMGPFYYWMGPPDAG